jgi:hypothetical protein
MNPQLPGGGSVRPAIGKGRCPNGGHKGKHFSMLKRHLMTDHQLTPDQYRQRWQLSPTYPIVAPAYAKTRSALARPRPWPEGSGTKEKMTGRKCATIAATPIFRPSAVARTCIYERPQRGKWMCKRRYRLGKCLSLGPVSLVPCHPRRGPVHLLGCDGRRRIQLRAVEWPDSARRRRPCLLIESGWPPIQAVSFLGSLHVSRGSARFGLPS